MAEIEQLRKLLIEREQQRLDELEQQLNDREHRIDSLGEILPESLQRLQHDRNLQLSLRPPLVHGIEETIQRNPKRFAAMFYPVLGPAIRRAVSEALKGLLENINRTMDHGFSLRSWRWRIEAWRAGVPFSQIVLKHTLAYSIDEVFLVQRHSGLLIARATRDSAEVLDRDAVAAMLTAIQRFMQESFAIDDDHPVRSLEVGEHTLWNIPGEHAVLVALIQGTVVREARHMLQTQLESLHQLHEQLLQNFHTYQGQQPVLDEELQSCLLRKELTVSSSNKLKKHIIRLCVLAIIVLGICFWYGWRWWWLDIDRDKLLQSLDQQPGWVVLNDTIDNGKIAVHALRDPLAVTPDEILTQHHIDAERVSFRLENYQSMDSQLAIKRLADAVGIPLSFLQLETQAQTAQPIDHGQWFSVAKPVKRSVWQDLQVLDRSLGLQLLKAPNLDLGNLSRILAAPENVELQWRGDVLVLNGQVDARWRDGLQARLAEFGVDVIVDDLSIVTFEHYASLFQQRWNNQLLVFADNTVLNADGADTLALFTQEAIALKSLSGENVLPFTMQISGLTDGEFTTPLNTGLRTQRAQSIQNELMAAGFASELISIAEISQASAEDNVRAVRITLQERADGNGSGQD